MSGLVMYGQPVVDSIREDVLKTVEKLGEKLGLVLIGSQSNPQWAQYSKSLENSASSFGTDVVNFDLTDTIDKNSFLELIQGYNKMKHCHGVLIQQPLPTHLAECVNSLHQNKDIDGLTEKNIYSLYTQREVFVPATAMAVIKLLEHYNIEIYGKNVVILGRGIAVGKPLSLMFLNRNATPTICHTKTKNASELAKNADILVSACGQAGMVDCSYIGKNAVVVDVGLSFIDGKTCGDVNFVEAIEVARAVSPVPKGIGPLTRACLFQNLAKATILNQQ